MPVRGSHPPYTGLQPSRFTSSGHGQFHHEKRLIDGIGFAHAEWLRLERPLRCLHSHPLRDLHRVECWLLQHDQHFIPPASNDLAPTG